MSSPPQQYCRLTELLGEIVDLNNLAAIAYWDRQTYMPSGGASARKQQLTTLSSLTHKKMTDPTIGELLEQLTDYEDSLPYDSHEAATIRVARRDYRQAKRIPPELVAQRSEASAEGLQAWLQAREEADFSVFLPALRRNYDVTRRIAQALKPDWDPLDTLIDRREPGFTASEVGDIFSQLKEELLPLIDAVSQQAVDDSVLHQHYPEQLQWENTLDAVSSIGFDLEQRGRQDRSVHPFTTSFSPDDVRITTRVRENDFSAAFFASLHEAGHGTYEQGLTDELCRSILGQGASGGMHESQSRLWENLVGRSRQFWHFFYPRLQKRFSSQTDGVSVEDFYRAVNRVQPSLIRVEADEVTYNLHIIIRFELENAVYSGELSPADLEAAWNDKYSDYLGITPSDPVQGILQDIHWSGGFGASFVSYTLGNVISVQLFEAAQREYPDLLQQFERGDFCSLLKWMQTNVHAHGRKFKPKELIRRATGQDLSTVPYLNYIRSKISDVYDL